MSLTHTDSTAEHAPKSDVVAGVKSLLLQQRETLKKQEHELETLRTELAQSKRKTAQLQAKADADEKAMTELEAFLAKEGGDATQGENQSVAA
jgi:septal ring factor EnvC (AmiA/AmiB activator)